jgi:hypothetical protein
MVKITDYQSQGLTIPSLDILSQSETGLEPLLFKNTIAEYLFPDSKFSIGTLYRSTTSEQLENLPNCQLAFAAGDKVYLSDRGGEREKIFPVPSDAAAYGSIPMTECRNFAEAQDCRVAIVDDETGENSLGLNPEAAKRLVGDCYGKSDETLHSSIGGEENTAFQFRIGIKEQEGTPARIAKGTLSPTNLKPYGVDLILAKSSFKGRKGTDNQEIAVGTYRWTVGVGIKTHAYRAKQSLGAQILVNYPKAVAALLPLIEHRLEELGKVATDPVLLAKDYLENVRKRYEHLAKEQIEEMRELEQESQEDEGLEALAEVQSKGPKQERLFRLIERDVDNHQQLLEHPQVTNALNNYLRKEYLELATGRFAEFDSALLQPSLNLKEDEFCDPTLPEGVKVMVTRSPFLNSNNFITLTNRHLKEAKELRGVVFMNPARAASSLQGDFDGDRVAFSPVPRQVNPKAPREKQLWQKFLIALAAEIEEKQKPEQRYAEVIKKRKIPYTGSFAEVAISARENKIGAIARLVMKVISLENELEVLPDAEKTSYLQRIASWMAGSLKKKITDLFRFYPNGRGSR